MKFAHRFAFALITLAAVASLSLAALLPAEAAPVTRPLHDLNDGLVSYWALDESSPSLTAADIAVNNDMTAAIPGVSFVDGKIGNAASFDTHPNYSQAPEFTVGDNSTLNLTSGGFTVAAWFYPKHMSHCFYNEAIITKWGDPGNQEWSLHGNCSNEIIFEISGDGTAYTLVESATFTQAWHFAVGWFDPNTDTINVQIDNGTIYSEAFTGDVYNGVADLQIGGWGTYYIYADSGMNVDEVGLWDRPLGDEERTALWNGGYGCAFPFSDCEGLAENSNELSNGNFEDSTTYLDPWELNGQFIVDEPGDGLQPVTGPAFCGNNYVRVDPDFWRDTIYDYPNPSYELWRERPVLSQRFFWPGGTAYFQARLRTSTNRSTGVGIIIRRVVSGFDVPGGLTGFDGYINPSGQWQLKQATGTLPAGWYDIEFYSEYGVGVADPVSAMWEPDFPDLFPPYYVDDVTISQNSYLSYCNGIEGGPTITPRPSSTSTPTRTSTPTGTIAVSATPTRTPTSGPASSWSNCGFEQGLNGWQGSATVTLAGGPIGPRYAQVSNGAIMSQQFTMPTNGVGYFTFWVGPGSYGTVRIRNTASQVINTIHVAANTAQWTRRDVSVPGLVAGRYAFEVLASINRTMSIDGVMVGINGFQYCSASGGVGTPITPTSGPTSYITATPSLTTQFTRTPTFTFTPAPTRTTGPSNTPQPSSTSLPTSTPIPTDTQSAAQQTATAQGTTIPTYTPYPTYTPAPTYTVVPPPPEQPEPSFYADCIRPQNAADLAGWIEYNTCYALSWFAWGDINSQQVASIQGTATAKEPFGSVAEVGDLWNDYRDLWEQYDWDDTGMDGSTADADSGIFTQPASGILIGEFDLGGTSSAGSSTTCHFRLETIIGPFITQPICFLYNTLYRLGALAWVQLLFDLGMLIMLLIRYLPKAWVQKATNG